MKNVYHKLIIRINNLIKLILIILLENIKNKYKMLINIMKRILNNLNYKLKNIRIESNYYNNRIIKNS